MKTIMIILILLIIIAAILIPSTVIIVERASPGSDFLSPDDLRATEGAGAWATQQAARATEGSQP